MGHGNPINGRYDRFSFSLMLFENEKYKFHNHPAVSCYCFEAHLCMVSEYTFKTLGIRDTEDHIAWLLEHGHHEKALAAVEAGQGRSELLDEVLFII